MRLSLLFLVLLNVPAFALDSPRPALLLVEEQPWAAWVERSGPVTVGRVARWDGQEWQSLGGALNTDPALAVASVALAESGGTVWAAWGEKPPNLTGKDVGSGLLHVARWTGRQWQEPAPSPSRSDKTVSERPVMRMDSSGRPWVLWSEITPDFNVENVYLAVLEGSTWKMIDSGSLTTDISSASRSRDLALTKAGPLLAFSKLIYKHDFQVFVGPWAGGRWEPVAGARNTNPDAWAGFPTLALDTAGVPTVAFVQAGGFRLVVQQQRGAGWVTLGAPGGSGVRGPRLASAGTSPVLTWIEPGIGLRTARWDGSEWQDFTGAISSPGAFVDTADLAVDAQGRPWILWAEDDARGQRLGLANWDGRWVALPPPPLR